MIGSDAAIQQFRHYQSYGLLQSMLSNLAAIDFDEIAVTVTSTTDAFLIKKATAAIGTYTVTYSSAERDIVSGIVYVAA